VQRLTFALYVLVAFCAAPLSGQTLGEITGRVSDPSGASVPGAVITLINVSTNGVRATTSTSAGDYAFPAVAPGFYNLKTEHPGFKLAASNHFEVQVQQTLRLDVTLEVG
jgi:protocatechuate 3,4-dioxygenase beta subunit